MILKTPAERLEDFKAGYEKLVQETGIAMSTNVAFVDITTKKDEKNESTTTEG